MVQGIVREPVSSAAQVGRHVVCADRGRLSAHDRQLRQRVRLPGRPVARQHPISQHQHERPLQASADHLRRHQHHGRRHRRPRRHVLHQADRQVRLVQAVQLSVRQQVLPRHGLQYHSTQLKSL